MNLLQHNKGHIQQTHSNCYSRWWKYESISSKIRCKTRVPISPLLIKIILEILATAIRKEKEITVIQIGKEEVKLSLFANDVILYIETPKYATRELLLLINEYSKFVGYKINTQKSLALLYTNNETSEREIKKIIPSSIEIKGIK